MKLDISIWFHSVINQLALYLVRIIQVPACFWPTIFLSLLESTRASRCDKPKFETWTEQMPPGIWFAAACFVKLMWTCFVPMTNNIFLIMIIFRIPRLLCFFFLQKTTFKYHHPRLSTSLQSALQGDELGGGTSSWGAEELDAWLGETPIAGWVLLGKKPFQWMMTRGTPYFSTPPYIFMI